MKALLRSLLVWLPLAATFAQTPPRDIDSLLVGRSSPVPPRGQVQDVAVQDGIAYCAMAGFGLAIYDVRDPARLRFLGAHATPGSGSDRARAVAMFGTYACVAGELLFLSIFDVKNPAEPRLVGHVRWDGWMPTDMAVAGHYAYVISDGGLRVIDLSDPGDPQALGGITFGSTEQPDFPHALAVSGDYAYVTYSRPTSENEWGLRVIKITDPNRLVELGGYHLPGASGGLAIAVRGAHAFVADGAAGLQVLDISDPSAARPVGRFQMSGQPWAIVLSGEVGYVAAAILGDSMIYAINVQDPTNPRLMGSTSTLGRGYVASELAVSGQHVYAAVGRDGLRVIDVGDPAKPQVVGAVETEDEGGVVYDLAIRGSRAILAEGWAGLQIIEIIDVSDPNWMRRIGGHATDGEAKRLVVQGDLAYTLARKYDEPAGMDVVSLETFDLSNASTPLRLGVFRSQKIKSIRDLEVSGNYAYLLGGGASGREAGWLEIVDVSQPASPSEVSGSALGVPYPQAVAVVGTHAYVGLRDYVQIVDVQDPTNPKQLSHVNLGAEDLALAGSYLYGLGGGGLNVVDVSDPAKPQVLSLAPPVHPTWGQRVVFAGTRAYVLAGSLVHAMDISDVSNPRWVGKARLSHGAQAAVVLGERLLVAEASSAGPVPPNRPEPYELIEFRWANPQRIGTFDYGRPWYGVLRISGDYAYLAATESRGGKLVNVLETVSLRDPAKPALVGTFELSGAVSGMAVSGTRAYLASGGLQIIGITDPAFPKKLGSMTTGGEARDVVVSGNHAFVAASFAGLSVIDATDPTRPKLVGGYPVEGLVGRLALAGNLLLACASVDSTPPAVLNFFDVTTPTSPKLLSTLPVRGDPSEITISGDQVFFTAGGDLRIVEVSDPLQPREVGRAPASQGFGVAVASNYVYLVGDGGIQVFDVSDPTSPRLVGGNSVVRGHSIALYQQRPVVLWFSGVTPVDTWYGGLTVLNPFVPLRLGSPDLPQRDLRLSIAGPPGWPVRIQRSADLTTWQDWQSVTLGNAPVELTDPEAASQPHRFYRAAAP